MGMVGRSVNSDSTGNSHDHSADAARYDEQVREHGCHAHEALFGLMYEFVQPGQRLLDIGIGTGLSSCLFHRAGLQISGFDCSQEMLDVCAAKGFAEQLVRHDLQDVPFPYAAHSCDHVISLGVLNFFADLAPVVAEAARIIRPQGIFAFTVEEQKPGQSAAYIFRIGGESAQQSEDVAVPMCRHSDAHVRELLAGSGFTPLKDFEFLADRYPAEGIDIYFKAYVARKA